jgi:type IV pilus assembly protein PilE
MPPSSRGFTLIEVMIVVAVVAILSAIAYPSYQEHVRRSHRSAAQAFMLDVAARQQQRLIDMRSYAPDLATLRIAPPVEVTPYYDFAVALVAGPPPGFNLSATPKHSQARDKCGTLGLDNTGSKSVSTAATGCW